MSQNNPYIGPRTFQRNEGHLFFGREREARDLISLVASERLVVFYAQSGAGKSSIVNTRLIPNLEEKGYEVLPVGRVSGDSAAGLTVDNVYAYNLMHSLEQHGTDPSILACLSLTEFLAHLNFDEKGFFYDPGPVEPLTDVHASTIARRALIIDQFEELFSTHPEAWEKREDFFKQLTQAMQDDPLLWVVLVMREDYIAALDAYAHYASNGLRARYYMQRLEREAALQAVKSPVKDLRPFEEGVAEKLIDDLRSIRVQKPDGSLDLQPGQYIEPVQLQVVCYGLWENLPSEGKQITEKDLQDVGDVNQSLGKYYDRRVEEVSKSKDVKQRLIREWFEKKLITAGGIRNMVLQEREKKSGELGDDVIRALQSDLVRAEKRGGATWYELTHDRLVEPILERNKIWFNENLSPLQRQAAFWKDQGQNETWLLSDQALVDVEEWAKLHADELTDIETDFLEECRTKQKEKEARLEFEAEQQKFLEGQKLGRQRRLITNISILAAILMAVLAGFGLYQTSVARINSNLANEQLRIAETAKAIAAVNAQLAQAAEATAVANQEVAIVQQEEAIRQRILAQSSLLSTQSNALREKNFQISMLLGIEAYQGFSNVQSLGALLNTAQSNPRLNQFLNGHSSNVLAVAFSPDGETLASGSSDNTIILWNLVTGQPIGEPFQGHTEAINSISFSSDGETLASGSSDGTIILWEVETHKVIGEPLAEHDDSVSSLALSGDGETLVTGSLDNTIIMWDVINTSRPKIKVKLFQPPESGIFGTTVAVSPSGRFLATGSGGGIVRFWDVNANQLMGRAAGGHTNAVSSVAFSADGETLASGSLDQTIILWNVETGQTIGKPFLGHTGPVSSVAFSPDGKFLASGSYDNTVILWDVETHQAIGQPYHGHTGPVSSVAFSLDGKTLASGSFDSTVILWDVETRSSIGESLEGHLDSVLSLAFDPSGRILASGSLDNRIMLWDVETYQIVSQPLREQTGSILSLAVSPDGKTIASGSKDNTILLWDIQTVQPIGQPLEGHDEAVTSVAFNPDGKMLASGSYDNTIILWDISNPSSLQMLARLTDHTDAVFSVAFSPNGKLLASGSSDDTIIVWNVSNASEPVQLGTLLGHTAEVTSVSFSPDGLIMASGSVDNTIKLWNVTLRQPIGDPLTGHKGAIFTLAFNPDGRSLASGSSDNTIILWNIETGQPIGEPLAGHSAPVLSLAFNPDGKTLASGSADKTIILWDLDPEAWLEKSCQRVGRNFTVAEWAQYFPNDTYRKTCEQWPLGLELNATPDEYLAIGTPTLSPDLILYRVINVTDADQLNIRAGPGTEYAVIGKIPQDGQGIQITGQGVQAENTIWVPIFYKEKSGWVNSYYIAPQ